MPSIEARKRWREKNPDYARKWREENATHTKKYFAKWYAANAEKRCEWYANNLERMMWLGAKNRAKRKGIKFNINVEDIIIPDRCPVLGVPIGIDDFAPSLDRMNPKRGYVKGNIQVMSRLANRIKNNASLDQLVLVGLWAKRTLRSRNATNRS